MKIIILLMSLVSLSCAAVPKPYQTPKNYPQITYIQVCDGTMVRGNFKGEKFGSVEDMAYKKMWAWYKSGNDQFHVHTIDLRFLKCH